VTAARRVASAGSVASSGPVAAADRVPGGSVDDLLAAARRRLHRLGPAAEGIVPGALHVERNVLEWRLDPRSEARLPAVTGYGQIVIIMCSQGYASSLAAGSLQDIGLRQATDLAGGFLAWARAGLPVVTGA